MFNPVLPATGLLRASHSAAASGPQPRPRFHRRDPVWFRSGLVAITPAARSALDLADASLRHLLDRHERGDWGLLRSDPASQRENEWALTHDAAVCSIFELPTGAQVLLITEDQRAVTSVLLAGAERTDPLRPAAPLRWIPARSARPRPPVAGKPRVPASRPQTVW